jgi:hypothetical protein
VLEALSYLKLLVFEALCYLKLLVFEALSYLKLLLFAALSYVELPVFEQCRGLLENSSKYELISIQSPSRTRPQI